MSKVENLVKEALLKFILPIKVIYQNYIKISLDQINVYSPLKYKGSKSYIILEDENLVDKN